MGSGGPQERNFDTGIAVLLNAFFHLFRCAAGGHSLDIGVWNRPDQPFHTALSVSFLEKRDVFFPDVRFANPHLRTGDKGNLHRIEFGGHFPPNGVQSLGVSSSTEQLMVCATSSLEKSRPAFSGDFLII